MAVFKDSFKNLNLLDRFLTLWILLCMVAGVLIGYYVPDVKDRLGHSEFAGVTTPMVIGLILMMYPILCKVRFEALRESLGSRGIWIQIGYSLTVNWLIAPLVMVALGWATLPDLREYRSGLVLVGTARCIAMVLVWNRLAGGDQEICAIIVVINSLIQLALYGPLSYLLVVVFSKGADMGLNIWPVVESVLVFLGIPLVAAVCTRLILRSRFPTFYDKKFLPWVGPLSLLSLLYVIVIMFASQGREIVDNLKTIFRVVVPLLCYFLIMFSAVLTLCYWRCIPYKLTAVHCFTAASNNFELAIAVAAGVYGASSKEAMAATIGPLVEVPVLLALVHGMLFVKSRWYDKKTETCGCKDD